MQPSTHSFLPSVVLGALAGLSVLAAENTLPPVALTDTPDFYVLTNGYVTAKVVKRNGNLFSLVYQGVEMLNAPRSGGYWSHAASGPRVLDTITIDPRSNAGERAEVSVKAISGGTPLGSGPGGSAVADIEIRYALGREDRGVYTYSIFEHRPEYPATAVGEARFCAKLNDVVFDWMTVDARRSQVAITAYDWNHGTVLNMKEVRRMTSGRYVGQVEHKYDYAAVQFDTPGFGWSSTQRHVGLWFVNPTIEYLSGGPTKVELCVHRDATFGTNPDAPAPPCVLNYWRGSHYGGSSCVVAAGEHWTKVIGPFLIYCNEGPTPEVMWKDALAVAAREAHAWPYPWVKGVDYPHREQRETVAGRLVLDDPLAPQALMTNLLVGLSAPDYSVRGGWRGPAMVDWQRDAKYYQFWARADEQGRFTIPNIRPGTYTLHAIANNVLGEFTRTNIAVAPGQALDLGRLEWKPRRFGRTLWEIGIPDRTAAEFRHGDHYWQWGLYNEYPKDFPNDVNFVIGKSDPRRDWNYCQCPRADRPDGTTWSVTFDLPKAPRGQATLRLALAATSARRITVAVNNQPAGDTGPLEDTAVIRRDGIRGYWCEHDITFDAALMRSGANVLTLTIPPGAASNGVEYDYLRLELQE